MWLLFAALSLPGLHALSLDDTLPFHPDVESGILDNGLEYFAVEHPHPRDRLILRLVVDAGSVLETDAQRGLAHFVEHMAFNGTEEFGETELVAYLESLGVRFGPDVNAYTSFDETVYMLQLPTDDEEAMGTGFQMGFEHLIDHDNMAHGFQDRAKRGGPDLCQFACRNFGQRLEHHIR
ncbi:MAG: insulinase family protein, partial [Spirochaetales bacterium]|nr:insulinase family protein [Spirochaetales bacterium]